ncbi:hypothetical protein Vadar_009029 [Vaccinium darrowii]|uniref:Uncharacterized protein n=1 Tax=Vaccinium darrowii TaxID=229202 RepID=A0ACB7ZI17_9ERIC|nr:hypothetical protein Vadar_009029 [Vaccinium darrowii]
MCKIINQGPWSVMGNLMILRKWDSHKTIEEMDFSCSPFWVQIQVLPLGHLNVRSGMKIEESLGEIIAVEDPDGKGRLAKYIWVGHSVNNYSESKFANLNIRGYDGSLRAKTLLDISNMEMAKSKNFSIPLFRNLRLPSEQLKEAKSQEAHAI